MERKGKRFEIILPRFKKSAWDDRIKKNGIQELFIGQGFEDRKVYDLAFLADLEGLETIESLIVDAECSSYSFLKLFPKLKQLRVGNHKIKAQELDLQHLPDLKGLSLTGDFDISGLELLCLKKIGVAETGQFPFSKLNDGIEELYLRNVKIDFQEMDQIRSLKSAEIIQIRNTLLRGLHLETVQRLSLGYCPKLEDYSFLSHCRSLSYLELQRCKNFPPDFEELLGSLELLQKLLLSDCGSIPSVRFVSKLPNLKVFTFWGTTVLDGDLKPCLSLEYASTDSKRSYNLKDKDLPKGKGFMF